ncbi:MAG: carbohydrate porin [Phycisphaerae bacterium]
MLKPALLSLALLPAAALAQIPTLTIQDDTSPTSPPAQPASSANYPTGNWWGLRDSLANNGFSVGGLLQLDVSKTLSGGLDTNRTPTRYLLDLNVTYDASKFLPDASFFLDFQSHDGPNASAATVGDIQGFDNLDSPHFVQIAQLWYQQLLFQKQFLIKAGKIDANADFSVIEHGKEFLNSAAAYADCNFPMVTYPDPAPGAEFFFSPTMPDNSRHNPYAAFAAFYSNGHQTFLDFVGHPQTVELISGGTYMIAEAGDRWTLHAHGQDLPGHAAIGGWYHTGEFNRLTNPAEQIHGAAGAYAFLDQSLYSSPASDNHPAKDLGIFLSAGLADPRSIPIQQNLAAGIAATGFIPSRPHDSLGLFAADAHLSEFQSHTPHHHELALELFYKLQLTPFFSLKPDLQYILSPAGQSPDATVLTLRAELDF